MTVVEQYLESKTGKVADCEDIIVVTDNFIAVVDGATSKSGKLWSGKTSGRIAAELAAEAVKSLDKKMDSFSAMQFVDSSITRWYRDQSIYEQLLKDPIERPTASIVLYSKHYQQLWLLGDCQAAVDGGVVTNNKKIDTMFEDLRAYYLEAELQAEKTVEDLLDYDTAREAIVPLIAKQTYFQNGSGDHEFIHGVLDGFFTDKSQIKKADIPKKAKEIVLASDGYPFLKMTLGESEEELAKVLHEDPLLFRKFRSTKGLKRENISFDDRAYIKFTA